MQLKCCLSLGLSGQVLYIYIYVTHTGYSLSPKALNILFNRFARRRQYMKIDDFAACLSRVKIMSGKCLSRVKIMSGKCVAQSACESVHDMRVVCRSCTVVCGSCMYVSVWVVCRSCMLVCMVVCRLCMVVCERAKRNMYGAGRPGNEATAHAYSLPIVHGSMQSLYGSVYAR